MPGRPTARPNGDPPSGTVSRLDRPNSQDPMPVAFLGHSRAAPTWMETMSNGSLTFWIVIAAASAAFGALYGILFHEGPAVLGVTYGTCIGVLAIAYERGALFPRYTTCLRRLPSLAYFAAAEMSLLLVIIIGMGVMGIVVRALGLTDKSLAEVVIPRPQAVIYAMAVSALLIGVLRMRDLIGRSTFTKPDPRSLSSPAQRGAHLPVPRSRRLDRLCGEARGLRGAGTAEGRVRDDCRTGSPTSRSDRRLHWRSGDHLLATDARHRAGQVHRMHLRDPTNAPR